MKQFRSLNLTYERLKSEVENLTRRSIEGTAELNSITYRLKLKKEEYEQLKIILEEDTFENKVAIKFYNKKFIEKLDKKDKELELLQLELSNKKIELNELNIKLQKQQIGLQVLETDLNSLERQLNAKDKLLNNTKYDLDRKTEEMIKIEADFNKQLKQKEKEYKNLEKYIK